ncbi:MAG: Asp-tRNA(Asn)/Glu-tRNA(Gln) amidotransferase subunit GatB [Candidatus Vesicomyosocius endoextente]|uniref:Aspartyl/glutamyl-tRNA(Asn/Gln) amidotransferase subunit B n=1 Tax=Candidatus Vesicomyosocius endoextente TaxID=2738853 RepID=A0A853G894_9GAMM|nr:Asp-tRNA(Asn)/Glu-tRNA(Gln) amidotransferase subunit GatB [Candidatus Vesicomyosocius endoextente]
MEWETVIGLEIHVQLNTKSKIFSSALTKYGKKPNSQACAVDLGLPGVLPVLNIEAVNKAIRFGVSINAHINKCNIFDRKNYFYPDLPKGYQISQMDWPIVGKGKIEIILGNQTKVIGITRAHLEEDAGKSIHDMFDDNTAIDLNRAGIPLLEIVSEPDISSAKEAVAYTKKVHTLVQYIDICDGNMQEGSFRFDVNISIRPKGQKELGIRTELKNINSFKFLERAINFEVKRQKDVLEDSEKVVQETRLYDSVKNETRSMRLKEETNDYRYFPDPDLLPVEISNELLEKVKQTLPELPDQKKIRFVTELGLSEYDADVLISQKSLADYFEVMLENNIVNAKLCANWVMGELSAALNKYQINIQNSPITAQSLSLLISRISDDTISVKTAKDVFKYMWDSKNSADEIIRVKGLKQMTNMVEIEVIIEQVIANSTLQVSQFKLGNNKILGFFIGKIMKLTSGKVNPKQVNKLLRKKLL